MPSISVTTAQLDATILLTSIADLYSTRCDDVVLRTSVPLLCSLVSILSALICCCDVYLTFCVLFFFVKWVYSRVVEPSRCVSSPRDDIGCVNRTISVNPAVQHSQRGRGARRHEVVVQHPQGDENT